MLWKISKKFQVSAEKLIPDAIVFCLGLTVVIYIIGLFVPGSNPITMINGWYDSMWGQLSFACQMSLLVLFTSAAAQAPQIRKVLGKIAKIPKSRVSGILCIIAGLFPV
ncbi:MAG: TIGR00366 family protein [Coprococcus sp.]|nr:TIGR00366 family protein [Coprococcus sp.]